MRILQATTFFSPLHGGAAVVPYQLSRELAQRGHEVTVYTADISRPEAGWEYSESLQGVKVCAFKTWLNLSDFHITPGMVRAAKKETRHFDVIHLHNYRTFQNVVMHHYARNYGVPYVLQAHGSLPRILAKKRLKELYDNLWGYSLLRDASRLLAVTAIEAEQYRSMGVGEDKIEIVPHGIDLSEFSKLPPRGDFRRRRGLKEEHRIILYLGRIHRVKGLDLLAHAFAGLSRRLADVRLVVVGQDGGYLSPLKRLVASLGIADRVLFTGALYGREKIEAYVDADVYVLPSSYEIFGITVLEAWASGTPVIVTDRCGLADVVAGEQAGVVVSYDKDQLSEALFRILSNERERREFGKRGRELVRERFNWERIAEQVEKVYQRILKA